MARKLKYRSVSGSIKSSCTGYPYFVVSFFLCPDFWDTAGQERFNSMHPSYYYKAHACLLVRKLHLLVGTLGGCFLTGLLVRCLMWDARAHTRICRSGTQNSESTAPTFQPSSVRTRSTVSPTHPYMGLCPRVPSSLPPESDPLHWQLTRRSPRSHLIYQQNTTCPSSLRRLPTAPM